MTVIDLHAIKEKIELSEKYKTIKEYPLVGFQRVRLCRIESKDSALDGAYAVIYITPPWAEADLFYVMAEFHASSLEEAEFVSDVMHRAVETADLFSYQYNMDCWESHHIEAAVEQAKEMLGIGPEDEAYLRRLLSKGDKA